MNTFQIFEGCWVEELLEYSLCPQGYNQMQWVDVSSGQISDQ